MIIKVPKLRKSDGKMKDTFIQAIEVKGFEDATLQYQGKAYAGCKVYAVNGSFKVFAPKAVLAQAMAQALATGQMQEIALGGAMGKAISAPMPEAMKVKEITNAKVVTGGGFISAAGWGVKKLGGGL